MKIIAELGSNYKTFEDCKNAIGLAKNCGADAIKFQLYTHMELYGLPGTLPGEMPKEWIEPLALKAKATGIEFMCTAFSAEGVRFIDPYVVNHKLASSEMCHVEMIEELCKTQKHVYVSTGGQTQSDIRMMRTYFTDATFLYCEASYPARHIDMRKLALLQNIAACANVGFSDHSIDVFTTPMAALNAGAVVLEKHFNPFEYTDTPDAPHSLNCDDFKAMTRCLNGKDMKLDFHFGPTKAERPMMLRHKRRVIATKYIKKGDSFLPGVNFGIFRSKVDDEKGSHPFLIGMARDLLAPKDYIAGEPIDFHWVDYDCYE